LIHPRKEGKGDPRGEGFELRTDRSGALRAAEGLLVLSDGRQDAVGKQLDRAETIALLEQALEVAKMLGDASDTHHADGTDTEEQERLLRDVKQWEDGSNTAREAPVKSNKAILAATAPDGIALAADANLNLSAGSNIDQIALQDNNLSVGRHLRMRIGETFSLFVKKLGMKLIAAAGKIQVQAQDGEIEIGAAEKLHLYSLKEILIEAPKVTIRGEDGSVEYAQGILSRTTANHTLHAANLSMPGPASVTAQLPGMPASTMRTDERFVLVYPSGEAVKGIQHKINDRQENVEEAGATGEAGKTNQVKGAAIARVSMDLSLPEEEPPPAIEDLFPEDEEKESGLYDEQPQLVAPPIEGVPWYIESGDGQTRSGRVGADGLLPRIETQKEEELTVYWGDEALAKMEGA
jgi:type VI secretion system secreted protein VgrG